MLISSGLMCVSAYSTNSWNLVVSQVDVSYFYTNGGHTNSSWSVIRQRDWIDCRSLASNFNNAVVSTDNDSNIVYQLEYIYDNGDQHVACDLGGKWNKMYYKVTNLIIDTSELCGGSAAPPTINGNKVTTSEYQQLHNQISECTEQLTELIENIRESYYLVSQNYNQVSSDLFNSGVEIFDTIWNALGLIIQDFGTGTGMTNNLLGMSWSTNEIKAIADSVSGIVKTFAYGIAVILFGINVTNTALQYELLTLRGGIKVFVRVLLVKIWIDLAIPICLYVLNIINSLATQIISTFTIYTNKIISHGDIINFENQTGVGWLDSIINGVNMIINFFASLITSLPMLILVVVLIVCVCSVVTKIIARAFEITCLVTISPLFFATLVGDETKHYFRKFMSAFLSTTGYIVFIAIVYAVATQWINECTHVTISGLSDIALAIFSTLPRSLIVIACCNIMKKPPKVLTSLFDGG